MKVTSLLITYGDSEAAIGGPNRVPVVIIVRDADLG
jgi:hypothetical protein